MKRASLVAALSLFSLNLPSLARAADPPGAQADPFAPQPEPSHSEPDEEALLRGPTQPNPNPPSPPPAAAPAPGPRATARANNRRAAQASDEKVAVAAAPGADESALAVELSRLVGNLPDGEWGAALTSADAIRSIRRRATT